MKKEKIFITGLGCISAMGYGIDQTWSNLQQGVSGIKVKTDWRNDQIHPHLFGTVPDIIFKEEVNWRETLLPVTYSKLAIYACKKAIEDAGLKLQDSDNEIGMVISTSFGSTESVEDYLFDLYQRGISKLSPIKFTRTVANSVLGDVSRFFKLSGPSSLVFNENSIGYGIDLIENGYTNMVICGAVDHFTDSYVLSEQETGGLVDKGKSQIQCIQEATDVRQKILGDGSCFIVIESESSLRKRRGTAYSEIKSYKSSFDGENVESTMERSSEILLKNIELASQDINTDFNLMIVSPYLTDIQIAKSEPEVVFSTLRAREYYHTLHKNFTGDMRSASVLFGTLLASKCLREQKLIHFLKQSEDAKLDYAFISSNHEGGSSSYILLKSILPNNK